MEYPKVKPCLNTSENDLVQELYQPCLQWASRFDRGVGYFTTGWLTHNVAGLSDFAGDQQWRGCEGSRALLFTQKPSNQ